MHFAFFLDPFVQLTTHSVYEEVLCSLSRKAKLFLFYRFFPVAHNFAFFLPVWFWQKLNFLLVFKGFFITETVWLNPLKFRASFQEVSLLVELYDWIWARLRCAIFEKTSQSKQPKILVLDFTNDKLIIPHTSSTHVPSPLVSGF